MQKSNLQQMSKVTGIYFNTGTISEDDKQTVLSSIHESLMSGNVISQTDYYSIPKIDEFAITMNHLHEQHLSTIQENSSQTSTNTSFLKVVQSTNNQNTSITGDYTKGATSVNQPKIRQKTRLELRLNLSREGNETELQQLQRQLQEAINQMLQVDPNIKFFPWLDREQEIALEKSQIPCDKKVINK
jgi:hypothetical protein